MRSILPQRSSTSSTPASSALSAEAIDRIIAAVGSSPSDLDKVALWLEVDFVVRFYQADGRLHSKMGQRDRQATAAAIARHAGELLRHLDAADDVLGPRLRRRRQGDPFHLGITAQSFDEIIAGIRVLKAIGEAEAAPPEPADPINATPLKFLITITLREVYEQHFKKKAGRSSSPLSGEVFGPYVRFVRAVLAEVGDDVSPSTIGTYLKHTWG